MTKSISQSRVAGLVIGGRSESTPVERRCKSAINPYGERLLATFYESKFLRNVISIVKNARKCTISVKAKSAKNENQVALLTK